MPGAISRTTGSATRWNSLTPFFMRQGSDQPFTVTIGWNGRPSGGSGGSCVAAEVWIAASGSNAAPARLTAAAPSRVAPAALKKVLRWFMSKASSVVDGGGGRRSPGRIDDGVAAGGPAGERGLQIGLCEPVAT